MVFTLNVMCERRQALRIGELVKSYWPLVSRIKEAEGAARQHREDTAAAQADVRRMQGLLDELM